MADAPRDAYGRFTGAPPPADERRSRFQAGAVAKTRSPFDAGVPDNLIADTQERARFCTGKATRIVESEILLRAGRGQRVVRSEEVQFPGRRDE